jgi:long-chain acyl-CoA synthetase
MVRSAGRFMGLPDWLFRLIQPFYALDPRGESYLIGLKRIFQNGLLKWDGSDKLPQIQQRALVLRGERDRLFSHDSYAEYAALLPNGNLIDIGVSKHQIPLERPRAVLRAVQRFLEQDDAVRKQPRWRRDENSALGLDLLTNRPWIARYPETAPRSIDAPRIPITRILDYAARNFGRKIAWQFGRERMTYEQFDAQVRRLAGALQTIGVSHGDQVLLCLPNTPHFPTAFYALMRCGATAICCDPAAPADQLIAQAQLTHAMLLIVPEQLLDSAETILAATAIDKIIITSEEDYGTKRKQRHAHRHEDRIERHHKPPAPHQLRWHTLLENDVSFETMLVDSAETAAILFTPDAVNRPIPLSHRNLMAASTQSAAWARAEMFARGAIMSAVPFHSAIGLTLGVNLPIQLAGRMDIEPHDDHDAFLRALWLWKPTTMIGTPRFYAQLSHRHDLAEFMPPIRPLFVCTGAPFSVEKLETFERLSRGQILECYGMTETAGITHCNPVKDRRAGSVGVPLPGVEAEIRHLKTGATLSFYEVGELYVRAAQVSAAVAEGEWLATGDLAEIDGDGYFHILGRLDSVYQADAQTPVYTRDTEEVLYERPEVDEVAVFVAEEGLVACVKLAGDGVVSAENLLAFCRDRLPENNVPQRIVFVENIPRNFAGRVLLDRLQAQITASHPT